MKCFVYSISILLATFVLLRAQNKGKEAMRFYVGTYTSADSQGIELYELNTKTGKLRFLRNFPGIKNASYLRFSDNGRFLYAVNELTEWQNKPTGTITAFAVEKKTGNLHPINQVASHGRAPCYLEMSHDGHFVLLNNYLDGTVLSYAVSADGGLDTVISLIRFHKASGVIQRRQEAPHVHSVVLNPKNTFALVADLGADRLTVLAFAQNTGFLTLLPDRSVQTAPGAGPRHSVFSANGKYVYVANELNSTVEVFSFDVHTGRLTPLQTISTVPNDYAGINYPADIHLCPDGKFLYVSNRGHESMAVFSVHASNGTLSFLGTDSVYGSWPRNFSLTPDGAFVIVANQKTNNLVLFRRNGLNGRLKKLDSISTMAAPACIAFYPH